MALRAWTARVATPQTPNTHLLKICSGRLRVREDFLYSFEVDVSPRRRRRRHRLRSRRGGHDVAVGQLFRGAHHGPGAVDNHGGARRVQHRPQGAGRAGQQVQRDGALKDRRFLHRRDDLEARLDESGDDVSAQKPRPPTTSAVPGVGLVNWVLAWRRASR